MLESGCFVAVESASGQVIAYYTLASASIATPGLPSDEAKRLPRYPTLPAVRIGHLAVDRRWQGRGLGKALLADAAIKAMNAAPSSLALLVDAKESGRRISTNTTASARLATCQESRFYPWLRLEKPCWAD